MTIRTTLFHTLEELRRYVIQVLCEQDELEPDAFPFTERLLLKNNRPCGMYYCLYGPRQVRFSAVWDAVRNIVLFYGASGERFAMTKLIEAPVLVTS
jgi:hypothetical protein